MPLFSVGEPVLVSLGVCLLSEGLGVMVLLGWGSHWVGLVAVLWVMMVAGEGPLGPYDFPEVPGLMEALVGFHFLLLLLPYFLLTCLLRVSLDLSFPGPYLVFPGPFLDPDYSLLGAGSTGVNPWFIPGCELYGGGLAVGSTLVCFWISHI